MRHDVRHRQAQQQRQDRRKQGLVEGEANHLACGWGLQDLDERSQWASLGALQADLQDAGKRVQEKQPQEDQGGQPEEEIGSRNTRKKRKTRNVKVVAWIYMSPDIKIMPLEPYSPEDGFCPGFDPFFAVSADYFWV